MRVDKEFTIEEIKKAEVYFGVPWRVMREIISNSKLKKLIKDFTIMELEGGDECNL